MIRRIINKLRGWSLRRAKAATAVFIGLVSIVMVVYDIFALYVWGAEATISNVINEWSYDAHPLLVFLFGVITGGLLVHFLEWKPVGRDE